MPVSLSLPTPGAITVMCGKTPPTWTRGSGGSSEAAPRRTTAANPSPSFVTSASLPVLADDDATGSILHACRAG